MSHDVSHKRKGLAGTMAGTRSINRLSALAVKTAAPGRHADGGGLYLEVKQSGARSWLFVFRWGGKRPEIGLGAFPGVSLAEAREQAEACRRAIRQSIDPRVARTGASNRLTFGEFADQWLVRNQARWKNPKHAAQWRSTLETYAKPIWETPVSQVSTDHIVTCLEPIWTRVPETASRVRGRLETVLNAATSSGARRGDNPARWKGHLANLLPPARKLSRGHHAALPFTHAPAFIASLRQRPAVAALALEWTILTAARTGETIGATWQEIDLDARIWTVPANRMKSKRPHRVPLSGRCLDILAEVQALGESFVFGADGRPLSNMAMDMLLRRMKVDVTVHGFRSTFRDWAGDETDHPREIIEAALAHVIGDNAERAYRRGDALEKRRLLMQDWARFLESSPSETLAAPAGAGAPSPS